ncbi:hypothetical protein V2H77_11685 [Photorhabdus sp. P32]
MKINKQFFNLAQSKARIAFKIESQIDWAIAMQYLRLSYEYD